MRQSRGPIEVHGHSEMPVCWRPCFGPSQTSFRSAGLPDLDRFRTGSMVKASKFSGQNRMMPSRSSIPAQLRSTKSWRRLLDAGSDRGGKARPEEIAIAAASPADFDDHVLALSQDAELPIHFVQGIKAVATADGQTAAALADVLVKGISQERVRRLFRRLNGTPAIANLPPDWPRVFRSMRHSPTSSGGSRPSHKRRKTTGRRASTGQGSCSAS